MTTPAALSLVLVLAGTNLAQVRPAPDAVAVVGAHVYTSPDAPLLSDATVVVAGGRITAVGPRASIAVPDGTHVIDGAGLTVTAGFWNSHVHFTDRQWNSAGSLPADQLSDQMVRMLTQYGYTHVVDTGSLLSNTLALRRRVESGDVFGPAILTAGDPFTARNGTPYYLKPLRLPELLSQPQATQAVRDHIAAGADAVKLHAGAILDRERDVRVALSRDLVRAVTTEAHRLGVPVLAHPQYLDGLSASVDGGVDVILHVTELMERWPPELLARAVTQGVALVPTLKLLAGTEATAKQAALLQQVREYRAAGGVILFGTDVGFSPDYNPEDEYLLMQQAGMNGLDILRALTLAPAERFRPASRTGQIAAGYEGDLVVLDGDPAQDVRSFTRVRGTVRGGRVIFAARPTPPGAPRPD